MARVNKSVAPNVDGLGESKASEQGWRDNKVHRARLAVMNGNYRFFVASLRWMTTLWDHSCG
jgi:hypothetical protein